MTDPSIDCSDSSDESGEADRGSTSAPLRPVVEEIGRPPSTDGSLGQRGRTPTKVTTALRAQIMDCWVAVTNAGGAVGFVPPITVEDVEPEVDRTLAAVHTGDRTLIVLRLGTDLVGFGFLARNDFVPFQHWVTLRALQIHPRWQRRSLGRTLLDGIVGIARAHGFEMLRLDYRSGLGLGEFYRRAGFVEVGRIPRGVRPVPGDDRDIVYMMRRLDS